MPLEGTEGYERIRGKMSVPPTPALTVCGVAVCLALAFGTSFSLVFVLFFLNHGVLNCPELTLQWVFSKLYIQSQNSHLCIVLL